MNLYLVVSEDIGEIADAIAGFVRYESRCIAELVIARNNSQARYLAWLEDKSYELDIREMPKFQTKCQAKNVDGPARIASDEYKSEDDRLWSFTEWLLEE